MGSPVYREKKCTPGRCIFFCLALAQEKGERGSFLKTELRLLIELQRIDTDTGKINMKKRDLPLRLAELDEAFAAFKSAMKDTATRVEDANKRHKDAEDKLKKGVESLRKAKDRLHEVKTNKEYNAVLKEIEVLEKKNGEIEEVIIGLLDEIDANGAALKVKERDLVEEQTRYETKRDEMQREIGSISTDLQSRLEEGETLRKSIPADLLKKYETIKNIHHGLAVVSAWKEVCNGCHMNIPPQMYNELFTSDELFLCPQCNRIIYGQEQNMNDA
jgi:uncharacterized protein